MRPTRLVSAFAALAFLFAPCAAVAAGSGGGAGPSMPSSSAGPRVDPAAAYQAGVAALTARDYEAAIDHFRDALRAAPRDPTLNYALGIAYVGNGDHANARRPLERAVRDANAPPDARLQLGLVYQRLGDAEKANEQLAALAQAIGACDSECGDARRAQLEAARHALEQALIGQDGAAPAGASWNFPSLHEGRLAYAAAVALINTDRFEEALVELGRAGAAIGPHPDVLNYQGFASRKLARYEAALSYYSEALAIDPDHLGANEYLGELYLELGRIDDARRQLARLDELCAFGCAEREELARWLEAANR